MAVSHAEETEPPRLPNIVIFYADDLGMGDVQAYDESSTIPTPAANKLAEEGVLFRDAHSASAVCTTSRYALLTGQHPFRSSLDDIVVRSSYDDPLILRSDDTIAELAQRAGYRTAAFGKWHLGNHWTNKEGDGIAKPGVGTQIFSTTDVDFTKPILDGPLQHGFDYFFGLGSTWNHGPYTFIENDHVVDLPARLREEQFLPGGSFRQGWVAPDWDDRQTNSEIADKAVEHLKALISSDSQHPFFVYFASAGNHWPFISADSYNDQPIRGRGGADDEQPDRNDMIVENDHMLGAILDALNDPNGDGDFSDSVASDTLFIFTSDNGADYGFHAPFRGQKSEIWEGGHRVPFIMRWPGRLPTGVVSNEFVLQTDLYGSLAALFDLPHDPSVAVDSRNALRNLGLSSEAQPIRTGLFQKDGRAEVFAVREGHLKLIVRNGTPTGLYDLSNDPSESDDLLKRSEEADHADTAARLFRYFQAQRGDPIE